MGLALLSLGVALFFAGLQIRSNPNLLSGTPGDEEPSGVVKFICWFFCVLGVIDIALYGMATLASDKIAPGPLSAMLGIPFTVSAIAAVTFTYLSIQYLVNK